ncbi:MAG: DNA polymerase I [bacterium]|nr:DNA polymerase I [bacterium]
MTRLFLIDGHGIAYKAFHALPPLSNSRGEMTNAAYGFTTMLHKLIKEEKPDYLAVALDTPGPTFRHQALPSYKAHRPSMPPEMRDQIKFIREIIRGFNLPCVMKEGYEADDCLATLAKRYKPEVDEVIIVTADKDMLQLVDDKIKVMAPKKGVSSIVIYTPEKVKEQFGVSPELMTDFLALTGDKSDNVPGVEGIGSTTAAGLIEEWGPLEAILGSVASISPPRIRKALIQAREKVTLSKELVTLDSQVPIDLSLSECRVGEFDRERLGEILSYLGFNRLLKEFHLAEKAEESKCRVINDSGQLQEVIDLIITAKKCAIDIEATASQPSTAELVGLSISIQPGRNPQSAIPGTHEVGAQSFYLPLGHHYQGMGQQLKEGDVIKKLQPVLEDEGIEKCGHNLKPAVFLLHQRGIELKGAGFDTEIASYLINPSGKHNLEAVAFEYLGEEIPSLKEVLGSESSLAASPMEGAAQYAGLKAETVLRLEKILEQKLKELELRDLYAEIEMPLIKVLAEMEENGVRLDTGHLARMSKQLAGRLTELVEKIFSLAGTTFNINSTKQLAHILFEKLGLPPTKRTKTGYSTNEEVLQKLALQHELPAYLLEYRELHKLKGTYVDALPRLIYPKTGRLHTSLNQTVTATGRLSSSEPNLQNIPIKTDLGRSIRNAFIPLEDGHFLLAADYSQIELRLLAHISGDEALTQAFQSGEDIHTRTAAGIYGVSPDKVTPAMRREAKVINFGVIYGMSNYGLAKELKISPFEAAEWIDRYFAIYQGVKQYIDQVTTEAEEKGYVTTLWQRRRYLPEIKSKNRNLREFARRTAINTPIQGSAADLIKLAMLKIAPQLKSRQAKMLLQVHDELIFDLPPEELEEMKVLVKEGMEQVADLSVPIEVEIKTGRNWGEME